MQPLSRIPHPSISLTRNKKLDTAVSLTQNDPSDPSSSPDTIVRIHRAPLAQIDQQLVTTTPKDLISPVISPLAHPPSELIPPSRAVGNPTMPRRSSYTGEETLFAAAGSSQSSAHRRLSQYVFNFHL